MRQLPDVDPGDPGKRTPVGYLLWVANRQKRSIAASVVFDTTWLLGLTLLPWAVGNAIDDGILAGHFPSLVRWVLVILGLSVIRAAAEPLRDRAGVNNWMQGAFRSAQLVGHHLTRVGQALTSRKSVGEIASVWGDATQLGHIYYLIGGLTGSLVSYTVVAVILLRASLVLGLFVLIGVPLFSGLLLLLSNPLQNRQRAQREASGKMTSLGADVVAGLRILRGIGGEQHFARRYQRASAVTQRAGIAIATPVAVLEGMQVLVGGILVVGITWIGSLQAVDGRLLPGQLVAFYGYAGFLVPPIQVIGEAISKFTRARVGAERILSVLDTAAAVTDSTAADSAGGRQGTDAAPLRPAAIHDTRTGLTIDPGTTVGVVSADPAESAALLDRVARFDDADLATSPVTWGGRSTTAIPLQGIRSRIAVADPEPKFFTGTLRTELDPTGLHTDAKIVRALHAAGADDILDALPAGLDTVTVERASAFSGGQRQRLGLARAMLTDVELLLLVEPTSAVDAHTEQRIAGRLMSSRTGRATVLATTSPLLLRRLERVVLLADGALIADGDHHSLLAGERYRAVVLRGGE